MVHLGTMGVYGYGTSGGEIPEGYLDVTLPGGRQVSEESIPLGGWDMLDCTQSGSSQSPRLALSCIIFSIPYHMTIRLTVIFLLGR